MSVNLIMEMKRNEELIILTYFFLFIETGALCSNQETGQYPADDNVEPRLPHRT